ncbi:MAG: extracellular solute-binding protein [Lachnospiraceae bacterium]|nr:extracellular solute-binding protein [Lachnospiraceae bacterium]
MMFRKMHAAAMAVMLLSLTLLLGGCHGARVSSAFGVPSNFDTSKKHAVTFWAKNDTNKNQTKIYEQAIADFEKLYPNITVNLRLYTDYIKIYNDVITNIATNTTPDVCITYPDHIATYMTGDNVVVPLDELISDSRFGLGGSELQFDGPTKEEMIPEFLEEGKIGGVSYAVPFMRSTEACYVNKDYVEKLGFELPETLTWDFIWEVSEAALEKDKDGLYKVNGQKVMLPFIYKSTDNMMIQSLQQLGAGYATENSEIEIFNEQTKEILKEVAAHTKTGAFSTFKISGYPANFLNAGQCIFAVDSTAGSTWMGSDAPLIDIAESALVDFETEVMMIPQYDPEHPQMISQGPSVCVFNKEDPQQVLASWLFTQYLLTNEVQIAYAQTEGYAPVTAKAQQSEEYQDYLARSGEDSDHYKVKIDATKLLLDHTADTFTTPVFNGSASLRVAAGQLIESVTKSVRRKATADDAFFENLFSEVTSLYHLDQIVPADSTDGKKPLGPLPTASKLLLGTLLAVWIGIICVFLAGKVRGSEKKS